MSRTKSIFRSAAGGNEVAADFDLASFGGGAAMERTAAPKASIAPIETVANQRRLMTRRSGEPTEYGKRAGKSRKAGPDCRRTATTVSNSAGLLILVISRSQ